MKETWSSLLDFKFYLNVLDQKGDHLGWGGEGGGGVHDYDNKKVND